MSALLYQLKAEFFKTLAHPTRIRVLELLSQRDHTVAELLPEIGIEAAHLSQQLAVLRRANLIAASRAGSTVSYSLTSSEVAELLAVARRILTGVLADLRAVSGAPPRRGGRHGRPDASLAAQPPGDSKAAIPLSRWMGVPDQDHLDANGRPPAHLADQMAR